MELCSTVAAAPVESLEYFDGRLGRKAVGLNLLNYASKIALVDVCSVEVDQGHS